MTKRPSSRSQCGRILQVLERGGWHSTRDLLREVPAVIHSRIAELRRSYGCTIEHRTTGPGAAGSEYRLAPLSAGEPWRDSAATTRGLGESSSPPGAVGPLAVPSPALSGASAQAGPGLDALASTAGREPAPPIAGSPGQQLSFEAAA